MAAVSTDLQHDRKCRPRVTTTSYHLPTAVSTSTPATVIRSASTSIVTSTTVKASSKPVVTSTNKAEPQYTVPSTTATTTEMVYVTQTSSTPNRNPTMVPYTPYLSPLTLDYMQRIVKYVAWKLGVTYDAPLLTEENVSILNAAVSDVIKTKNEFAMFLGHVLIETGGFQTITEKAAFSYAGCGYLQITGENNYRKASMDLFSDNRLVKDPLLVCNDQKVAWSTAVWYWKNAVRTFPGFEMDGKLYFGPTTMAINGIQCPGMYSPRSGTFIPGEKGSVSAAGNRIEAYRAVYEVMRINGPKASNCGCGLGTYELGKERKLIGTIGEYTEATLHCPQ